MRKMSTTSEISRLLNCLMIKHLILFSPFRENKHQTSSTGNWRSVAPRVFLSKMLFFFFFFFLPLIFCWATVVTIFQIFLFFILSSCFKLGQNL